MEHVLEGCQCEGKQCSKCKDIQCHGSFSPKQSQCKVCRNKLLNIRYHNNLEVERARNLASYHRHKEKRAEMRNASREVDSQRRKARYQQNREKVLQGQREYRLANPEKVKTNKKREYKKHASTYIAHSRKYHQDHPEAARIYAATYRRKHPDTKAAQKQRRRAKVAQNGGHFTAEEWQALKAQYQYTCLCCGRKEPDIKLCADHVIPIAHGGSSYIENIQPLCKSCNSKKHSKIIDYRR